MVDTHEHKGSRQDMARVALRSSRSFSYPTAAESSALAFALRVGEADPTGAPKPRLLDRVRAAIRARHYSRRTEKAYVAWIRRYIFFHDKRHPADMGAPEVTRFLSSLAVDGKVAASTQNQALSALLFLYGEVLAVDLPWMDEIVRAKRPQRLPVVLTRDEVRTVLRRLEGTPRLMAFLLYGAGLRLFECCCLRVQDVDFGTNQIVVRSGKGDKDRVTMLPAVVKPDLARHLQRVREQYRCDLEAGAGWVELPTALARKYPNAGREWVWQWTPHHLSSGTFPPRRVVERAARKHREENPERAIGNASESTGVSMPLASQAVVMGTAVRVILNTGASPVIEGVAQARIAPVAHADDERLTALARHRGDAPVRPQRLIVSVGQRPRGLGEHRGGDDSPHSRQGPEDGRVTVLSWNLLRTELLQQRFDPRGDFRALLVQQPQPREQQGDVGTGGLHRPRSNVQRWGLQRRSDRRHRKASDAIDLDHRRHGFRRQALGVGRGRDAIQQRPEPRVVRGRA
jgi:integron integrase